MNKKLVGAVLGAAALLATAAPAFAYSSAWIKNYSHLTNNVNTTADTGHNQIRSYEDDVEGGKIKTGDAFALADLTNVVNTNDVSLCGCEEGGWFEGRLIKNYSSLTNNVDTLANTGHNKIKASDDVEGGRIRTGNADAGSVVMNVVNTNTVGL